jgi:hypothetical protein
VHTTRTFQDYRSVHRASRASKPWTLSLAILLGGAVALGAGPASAETGGTKAGRKQAKEAGPDPMEEIEKLKAEFQHQLDEQLAASKAREETLKKEQAASVEAAREEAEKKLVAERNAREEEVAKLRKAIDAAAEHEDKREADAPPSVGSSLRGLSLYGYVQADYQARQSSEDQLNPTSGVPLNQDRFLIRRARLGMLFERAYGEGRIELDGNTVNGAALRLVGAEASLKLPGPGEHAPPLVKGTVGSFRIPFGIENPQDDRARFFLERSTAARAFFPGEYDLGARLSGAWNFVRYVLAVQNGQPLGSSSYPGLDPNHQKDILGRVGVESTIREKIDIVAGVSALRGTGFHSGKLANKSSLQWSDSNEDGTFSSSEVIASPALSAGPSSSFTRFAFGADVQGTARLLGLGETTVAAEFYLANDLDRGVFPADPNGIVGRSFREMGYYVSATQRLRIFMLGVRFDYYNPDQDANKDSKGSHVPIDVSYATLSGAAAVQAEWGRFVVEYDHNWNHLGIGPSGMPNNLKDDAIVARAEVKF